MIKKYFSIMVLIVLFPFPVLPFEMNSNNEHLTSNDKVEKPNNYIGISPGFSYIKDESTDDYSFTFIPEISYTRVVRDNIGISGNIACIKVLSGSSETDKDFHFYSFGIDATYYTNAFNENSFFILIGNSNFYEYKSINSSDVLTKFGVRYIYDNKIIDFYLGGNYKFYEKKESKFFASDYKFSLGVGISIGFIF